MYSSRWLEFITDNNIKKEKIGCNISICKVICCLKWTLKHFFTTLTLILRNIKTLFGNYITLITFLGDLLRNNWYHKYLVLKLTSLGKMAESRSLLKKTSTSGSIIATNLQIRPEKIHMLSVSPIKSILFGDKRRPIICMFRRRGKKNGLRMCQSWWIPRIKSMACSSCIVHFQAYTFNMSDLYLPGSFILSSM